MQKSTSTAVALFAALAGFTCAFAGTLQPSTSSSANYSTTTSDPLTIDMYYPYDVLNITFSGVISGNGSLTETGAAPLTLTGINTYTGGTFLNGGTLKVSTDANLGATSGALTFNGGTLAAIGAFSSARAITINNVTAQTFDNSGFHNHTGATFGGTSALTLSGNISGAGPLNKDDGNTLTLSGTNTYTGGTFITGGTLEVAGNAALGSGAITITGGGIRAAGDERNITNALNLAGNFTLGRSTNFSGATTLTSNVVITSGNPDLGGAGSSTLSGVISGAFSLGFAEGSNPIGLIALTGTNTYSGGTLFNGGIVSINNTSALGSGNLTFNGGTLTASTDLIFSKSISLSSGGGTLATGSGYLTFNGNVTGAGGLTKSGANLLTLNGAHTYTGATTVSGGSIRFGANGATASTLATSGLSLAAGTTAYFADSQTFAGTTSGAGVLNREAGGTTVLTGAIAHTGGTVINGGTLQIGNGGSTGTHSGATTLSNNGTLAFNRAGISVYTGAISGTGFVTKTGPGIVSLGGANTYSGATTISGGTLVFANRNALYNAVTGNWTAANLVVNSGGTAAFNIGGAGEFTSSDLAALSALGTASGGFKSGSSLGLDTTNAVGGTTYGNVIANPNGGANALGFAKLGTGQLTLTAANTYSGGTSVSAGSLLMGNVSALGTGPVSVASGALLDTAAYGLDLARLSGQGTATGSGVFSYSGASASTVANILAGTASVTKSGAGQFTLSGNNTFSGGTAVNAGTLALGSATALGAGPVVVASGATLDTGSYGLDLARLSGPGTATGTGIYSFTAGTDHAVATGLGGSASLSKAGTGTLTLSGTNTYSGTTTLSGGTLALGSASALGSGSLDFAGGTLQYSAANTVDYSSRLLLDSPGKTIRVDTNGQNVTWNGDVYAYNSSSYEDYSLNFVKSGSGTLTLNGYLNFAAGNGSSPGSITISEGTLEIGYLEYYVGITPIVDHGNLTLNAPGDFFSPISGTGSLTKKGNYDTRLKGANTYTGSTTVTVGTLVAGASGAFSASSAFTVASGAGLRLDSGYAQTIGSLAGAGSATLNAALGLGGDGTSTTFSGNLSGSGAITKTGAGAFTLAGSNSGFTGALNLNGGTVVAGNANALGTGGLITFSGGTLQFSASNTTDYSSRFSTSASQAFRINTGGQNVTFATALTSTGGSLTKLGAGTLTLGAVQAYGGPTTVSQGTLSLGASNRIADSSTLTVDGGSFDVGSFNETVASVNLVSGSITGTGTLTSAADYAISSGTLSTNLAGSSALVKTGSGTATLSGNNTYSGGATLNDGLVVIGSNTALGTGTVVLGGAGLQATGGARTVANAIQLSDDASISGTDSLTFTGNWQLSRTRQLTVENTTTLTGVISGARSLNKDGLGELVLTGANTYTGGTFIGEGTVRINNSTGSAFGTGAVTVASGATLTGAGSFTGAFQNNGTYAPGNSPTLATLSSFTQGSTGILVMELGGLARGTGYDALDITGSFTPGGTLTVSLINGFQPALGNSFDLFNFTSIGGTFATLDLADISGSGLTWDTSALYTIGILGVTAIPEPSTYAALLGACALTLVVCRRRRT